MDQRRPHSYIIRLSNAFIRLFASHWSPILLSIRWKFVNPTRTSSTDPLTHEIYYGISSHWMQGKNGGVLGRNDEIPPSDYYHFFAPLYGKVLFV